MKKSIMLIEDEELFQFLFREIFGREPYHITCVSHGRQSLEHPLHDLYIVDLGLPGMNGLETLEALQVKFKRRVRAFLITGYEPNLEPKALAHYGILKVLQKPFNIGRLKQEITGFFQST